ncbi:MAG TPA: bifunctional riboflavin kinase/FAD synthetase [Thermoanaerobaculaceae bacterium]|nr:bifunctional riboflavin kinase/FAD synthetase [Thermoanaerobaculaceae bacterium]HRS16652.1 bifunctional riboflavin kinase/FAD synthetase [Thermoanaerobaculaceae bacterium]
MEYLRDAASGHDLPQGGVVCIGNFDGVHRGHQEILRGAAARARELGSPSVVLTFDPHPEKVLRPDSQIRLLSTRAQRAQLVERLGIDALVELTFDRRLAATPAVTFAVEILHRRLRPREVWLGHDFRFGEGRAGDADLLSVLGLDLGFGVVPVPAVMDGAEPVSSTRVRREVARGHVAEAWKLLGRPFFVDGRVAVGRRMGRTLGFPTINIEVENELMPAHGVYVTGVHIPSFGPVFGSVTNIGVRPTVYERSNVVIECHVLDFTSDVYREEVRLFFYKRLRDERVFASSMELVAQIRRDVEAARLYFLQHGLAEAEVVRR